MTTSAGARVTTACDIDMLEPEAPMQHRTSPTQLRAACAFVLFVLLWTSPSARVHAQNLQLTAGSTLSPVVTAALRTTEYTPGSVYTGRDDIAVLPGGPVMGVDGLVVHLQDTASATGRMVVGGMIGGFLGMLVGGAAGAGLEMTLAGSCIDYCPLGGAAMGAVIGESLGMAFGVHAGNHRRGSFGAALVGPLGVVVGSLALAMVVDAGEVPGSFIVVGVPVLQLYASITGERAAARRRAESPE